MPDSIFPFIDTSLYEDNEENEELEELCEYAFDFENNCLMKNEAGQNYYVYQNEALKIWKLQIMKPIFPIINNIKNTQSINKTSCITI